LGNPGFQRLVRAETHHCVRADYNAAAPSSFHDFETLLAGSPHGELPGSPGSDAGFVGKARHDPERDPQQGKQFMPPGRYGCQYQRRHLGVYILVFGIHAVLRF
jgi:hypothetical protein